MQIVTNPGKPRGEKIAGRYFKYLSYMKYFGPFVIFAVAWLTFIGLAIGLSVAFGQRGIGPAVVCIIPAIVCTAYVLANLSGALARWYEYWYNKYVRNQHILYLSRDILDNLRGKMEFAGLPHENDDIIELLQANWESTQHIAGLQAALQEDIDTPVADDTKVVIDAALKAMAKERKAAVRRRNNDRILQHTKALNELNGNPSS